MIMSIHNHDDFRGQVALFAQLASNADDLDLYEISNAMKMHDQYGSFDNDPDLYQAACRVVDNELRTRELVR
jgi:hypothetical protein